MIEMTNFEYLFAQSCVKQHPFLTHDEFGKSYWEIRYETPIGFLYRSVEEAIDELVPWLREKHKENEK